MEVIKIGSGLLCKPRHTNPNDVKGYKSRDQSAKKIARKRVERILQHMGSGVQTSIVPPQLVTEIWVSAARANRTNLRNTALKTETAHDGGTVFWLEYNWFSNKR